MIVRLGCVVNFFRGVFLILFNKIKLEDKNIINTFFKTRYYEQSECTFTNLYMWRKAYDIEWAVEGNFLFIKATSQERTFSCHHLAQKKKC